MFVVPVASVSNVAVAPSHTELSAGCCVMVITGPDAILFSKTVSALVPPPQGEAVIRISGLLSRLTSEKATPKGFRAGEESGKFTGALKVMLPDVLVF